MKKRSQASFEYMLVVAIAMSIALGGVYLYSSYTSSAQDETSQAQAIILGNRITEAMVSIHYTAGFSRKVINFNVPDAVKDLAISTHGELVMVMSSSAGDYDLVFYPEIPPDKIVDYLYFEQRRDQMLPVNSIILENRVEEGESIIYMCWPDIWDPGGCSCWPDHDDCP